MFRDLKAIIDAEGRGVHAYQKCASRAYEDARSNPRYAAGYLLIAVAAERFVERNERMPTSTVQANEAYAAFSRFLDRLDSGLTSGEPSLALDALNAVAGDLASDT